MTNIQKLSFDCVMSNSNTNAIIFFKNIEELQATYIEVLEYFKNEAKYSIIKSIEDNKIIFETNSIIWFFNDLNDTLIIKSFDAELFDTITSYKKYKSLKKGNL